MCGVLGWIGDLRSGDRRIFEVALDLLAHRGPDDRGVFKDAKALLGHRRLSILDLTKAGHQPMVDPVTGAVICYNGEVYNYIELRLDLEKQGYHFQTRTDTEVVLRAFTHWGPECLKRFNGMWSFAIWQPKKKHVFFARDRFGVKPFYYTRQNGDFAFSSEPKALLSLFPDLRHVDHSTLYEFLALGQLYTHNRCFYTGIELLPPAHYGMFDARDGRFFVNRYWDYPKETDLGSEHGADEEMFRDLFNDAIQIRLRSDVPVGVSLSGGLDSTAILAASEQGSRGRRVCFTSVYGGTSRGEAGWARKAASPYGIKPIEVESPGNGWLNCMQDISWHMDAPGYSPAVFPVWNLMREAREQGIPVLLEGQGADEALGGYPQYSIVQLMSQVHHALLRPSLGSWRDAKNTWKGTVRTFSIQVSLLWLLREVFPWMIDIRRKHVGVLSVLKKEFIASAQTGNVRVTPETLNRSIDAVTKRLWEDHNRDILPGLLHYGDAMSMAHSIESRLPFMDYRLVEWVFSRDASIKIKNGESKYVLRRYLEQIGQSAIANRPDKLGYPTPVGNWLAKDGGGIPRELLLAEGAHIKEFCDQKRIEKLIKMHCSGRIGIDNHIYRLVSTELWMQRCISPQLARNVS